MVFADHITRSPYPHDPERGADVAALYPDVSRDLRKLITGTAGSSPYLADLLRRETAWVTTALRGPDAAITSLLAGVGNIAEADLAADLRRDKRRIAVLTALADLAGIWPLEKVTQILTDFADAAVQVTITTLVAAEVRRGKITASDDPANAAGMVVLAMGKMGAGELNYSSDIDLICLFDETRFDPDDYHDVRAAFIRVTRKMTAVLSDVRGGGYVFRTDLRLRPDPSVTPVCLSAEAAERYYESVGRTWERAAFIKARVCAGDKAAGARFLETLRPFVWRKHLDFAAIQDAHDMRLKIREHKGLNGALVLEGHNIKLGRGGIREIEFFTQTRQLIAGGRDQTLRPRGTRDGLDRLAQAGWIAAETAAQLYDHYRFLREVEHRLQMMNDAQTQTLPQDDAGFARLAALMGVGVDALRDDLMTRIEAVNRLTDDFFAPDAPAPLADPDWGSAITSQWPRYPALRSARATEIFARLKPEILRSLQDADKPDEALGQFDRFLASLPAGVQLFALFEANPQLMKLIVDICATAPALAQYLGRNAGVLDAVIGGAFFSDWPGVASLQAELAATLSASPDYEAQLIAARRWAKEWHFRVGVHFLRGLIDAAQAGVQYAQLAEAVIAALWPVVAAQFSEKHGAMPGRGGAVVAMGSLGLGQLTATSDLDLIMIYDAQGIDGSQGPRPLPTRTYFARLTQALVTALTAPMSEGRLYEVDMRLRPSGRQGPVATSFAAFKDYQKTQAWTWEHLALTRARAIAGDPSLLSEFEVFRRNLLREKSHNPTIAADVIDMRRRLSEAKPAQNAQDVKNGPGHLQDIALFAQAIALKSGDGAAAIPAQLQSGVAAGLLDAADADELSQHAQLWWNVQTASRLLANDRFEMTSLGEGAKRLLLRVTDHASIPELAEALENGALAADNMISHNLERL